MTEFITISTKPPDFSVRSACQQAGFFRRLFREICFTGNGNYFPEETGTGTISPSANFRISAAILAGSAESVCLKRRGL